MFNWNCFFLNLFIIIWTSMYTISMIKNQGIWATSILKWLTELYSENPMNKSNKSFISSSFALEIRGKKWTQKVTKVQKITLRQYKGQIWFCFISILEAKPAAYFTRMYLNSHSLLFDQVNDALPWHWGYSIHCLVRSGFQVSES